MASCMRLQIVAAALALAAAPAAATPAKLPDGLKVCRLNDPQLNECLTNAVTDAFPIMAEGVPDLGMPSIDPLLIPKMAIREGNGPVRINLEFTDLQLLGLRNAWMESSRINRDNFTIDGRVKFHGPIVLAGPYKVSGSVLVLPIVGDGICNYTLANLIADIHVDGDPYIKGGVKYMKIKTFDLKLTVSHLSIYLSNLFNGDKALGDTMLVFLNENWQEIYKELEPAFETTLAAAFKQVTSRFFQKVPYDKIFPEN